MGYLQEEYVDSQAATSSNPQTTLPTKTNSIIIGGRVTIPGLLCATCSQLLRSFLCSATECDACNLRKGACALGNSEFCGLSLMSLSYKFDALL